LVYEDVEPLPRLERGASDLRGRRSGQVSYRGLSWGTWARTRNLLGQDQARCPIAPFPIKYAGRDLNPQTARFELASFAELALPAPACAARDLNPDRDTG
jgi:hypothetical protein